MSPRHGTLQSKQERRVKMCCNVENYKIELAIKDSKRASELHKMLCMSVDFKNEGKKFSDLVDKINKDFFLKIPNLFIYSCWDANYLLLLAVVMLQDSVPSACSSLCARLFIKEVVRVENVLTISCCGGMDPREFLYTIMEKSNYVVGFKVIEC